MRGESFAVATARGAARRGALWAAIAVVGLLAIAALAVRWVATDTDGDGVADRADACPGTPPGRPVDASGCCAAARALAAAVHALRAPDAPAMEVGEAWFLQQLAAQRDDADLRALVADTERRLATHEAARLLRRDAAPIALPEDPGRGIARLATYVYAPLGEPADRAIGFIDDFTATPATGYVLTHQILVLEWARHVGVALPDAVWQRRDGLLARIAAEQAADTQFSDLFAERAAILLAFATPERGEADRWIDVIAPAVQPDGRWLSTRSPIAYDGQQATANHPWVHTTGFVAAATGFYLQRSGASAAPLP